MTADYRERPPIGTIEFPEDNDIGWFQDFRWSRGLPAGVVFEVRETHARYLLSAPGYGGDSTRGEYGNGPFFVPADGFPIHLIQVTP